MKALSDGRIVYYTFKTLFINGHPIYVNRILSNMIILPDDRILIAIRIINPNTFITEIEFDKHEQYPEAYDEVIRIFIFDIENKRVDFSLTIEDEMDAMVVSKGKIIIESYHLRIKLIFIFHKG